MADWTTISALATGAGTLVLAAATFASVRSNNRTARVAERALMAGSRPLLVPSRLDDPVQKVRWADDHWAEILGGRVYAEVVEGRIYLAMSLRNVGTGMAVIHSWQVVPFVEQERATRQPDIGDFRPQTRDLYIGAGDVGFWQVGLREPSEETYEPLRRAVAERRPLLVNLLYGDHEGGQRVVNSIAVTPLDDQWLPSLGRHWNLDRPNPR